MNTTCDLITSHQDIPVDAMAHGQIQAAAEIPFTVLEELAEELGAEKIPVHTLNHVGWFYTKANQIIELARKRGLSDWRYGGADIFETVEAFRATYC